MNENKKSLSDFTVKEALVTDIAAIKFRNKVIIDPAPLPFISITPIVIGAKAVKGSKNAFQKLKQKLL